MDIGNLEAYSPKLIPSCGEEDAIVWELGFADGSNELYLNPGAVITCTKAWVETRCRRAHEKRSISALPALLASGLIKTGKSYTLYNVIPAVLAEALRKQPPDHPLKGIKVLELSGLRVERQAGAAMLLRDLLRVVVKWAAVSGVPVKSAAWQEAQEVLADDPSGPGMRARAGSAVVALLCGFEAPVLVLLDELQALLHPTSARGELDLEGAAYIRDNVLRAILVDSPPTMLLAATGSSMALVWMALAAMPVNGVAPMYQIYQVDVPSTAPPGAMQQLLERSVQRFGLQQHQEDVQQLLERACGSPALFMTMVDRWDAESRPKDTVAFADAYILSKLFQEAQKEWMLSLAHWTDEERGKLLDLANPVIGADFGLDIMDPGLWRFLQPNLKETYGGRYYLADPIQRQLLRAIIDRGGKLRSSWTGLVGPGLTLAQLDWGWVLLQLGEVADHLLGLRRRSDINPDQIRGVKRLRKMLQDLANKAEEKLPPGDSVADRWESFDAFKQALESPHNTGSRRWYQDEGKGKKLQSHRDYLVIFLRLSRNLLAHQKPWERRKWMVMKTVMALPTLLGMQVPELSELVCVGLSRLAPATIMDAKAAADAEDEEWEELEEGEEGDEGEDDVGMAAAAEGADGGSPASGAKHGGATARAVHYDRGPNGAGLVSCMTSSSTRPQATALGSRALPLAIGRTGCMVLHAPPAHIRRVRVAAAQRTPLRVT
ncbi:hypothetical protein HXX76_014287 [Chlamydomonas incerta]|uniref:Uncharacterized protein n=1 Tax=Chlamydomonas incerta TaxID=51695 RepID=A0A835SFR9_CHLIN|nr:hypothetical protein HXX76_014287 [Chlamydomonas incerta]|eukprot:KAG2424711.1 hypothetical protein HXX76_014287 [Chlamydomonas incerta]